MTDDISVLNLHIGFKMYLENYTLTEINESETRINFTDKRESILKHFCLTRTKETVNPHDAHAEQEGQAGKSAGRMPWH